MVVLKAKLDHFTSPFHQCVQILSLSVAALENGNGRYVVAVFVTLNHDCEFSRGFHKWILTCEKAGEGVGLEPVNE